MARNTAANLPSANYGFLEVQAVSANDIRQYLTLTTGNPGEKWTRRYTPGSWSSWVRIYGTAEEIKSLFTPYTSGEISIVTSSLTTLTHGLGAEPKRVRAYLLCKTAEKGYAVGAKVELSPSTFYMASANDASGIQLSLPNATTIDISVGNCLPFFPYRAGGYATYITAANWRIIVEASL